MCGIFGLISISGRPFEPTVLEKMASVLRHRGPDDFGYWTSGRIALGHTRLAIIDLNTGAQPMTDGQGRAIVFNGEIYNYREIRKDLIGKGVVFRTESDTEVILEAYKVWGENCVCRLDGMFSFAIADKHKKCLFLARDRFGKKPLHYFYQDGIFIFASEIKAILQHNIVASSIDIDDCSLIDYLSLGYILSPKTIFKQIRRFPPANLAYIDWIKGELKFTRYWKLEDYYNLPKSDRSTKTEKEEFLNVFSNAVEKRLHADVPVGAFLSSGLDSTSVVSTAKSFETESLRAFSIGFHEKSYDESSDVKKIAAELGVDLEIGYFRHVSKTDISKIVWHFDEPFSDNSAQPTFQLNELASKFGKVMLSGDGADELFAGYPTYRANQFFQIYRKVPQLLKKSLLAGATKWLSPTYRKVSADYKVRRFLGGIGLTPQEAHYWWRVIFPFSAVQKILSEEVLESIDGYHPVHHFKEYFQTVKSLPFLDQALYVDAQTWLLDDILVKIDRMSMAHSVEVRSPFLDHNLAIYATQLPTKLKMNINGNKVIVRKSMSPTIPSIAIKGRKLGFNAPLNKSPELTMPDDSRFCPEFKLNPKTEDVTFQSINLITLKVWFDMFVQYKQTREWKPIDYGS